MRRTRLAAGILVALTHAAPPAGAAVTAERPVRLGATVTMTGRTSYSRLVQIDKPVSMRLGDWTVTAPRGRFAGFVLREEGRAEVRPTVLDIWPGSCTTKACPRAWWSVGGTCFCYFETGGPDDLTATLKPGRYRLYLVADGAPVTVRIPLRGLRGTTSIRTGTPFAPVVDTPAPAQLEPPIGTAGLGGNAYSAGSSHTVGRYGGLHLTVAWKYLVGAPRSANHAGVCFYDEPPTDGVPYQAPCPGGTGGHMLSGQVDVGSKGGPHGAFDLYVTDFKAFGLLPSGPVSIGAHLNSPGPATAAYAQNFWLDFVR